jgi:hypothetical protein
VIPIRLPVWPLCLLMVSVLTGALTACGKPAMVGLRPDYPAVERKWYALLTEFVEVDSLTPTFRWQPLDIALVDQSAPREDAPIDKVTYEIRIWQTVTGNPGKLVYARKQLTSTEHRLERPLNPGTRYYWSVRAHFKVDGRHRMTEWTLAGYLLRSETVPNDSCLRFKTPLEERIE